MPVELLASLGPRLYDEVVVVVIPEHTFDILLKCLVEIESSCERSERK